MRVSECEKFGYGTLVSQISTTRSGMSALCETGWIKSYIFELLDILEFENCHAGSLLDTSGENYVKSVSNILKALSTFSGVSSCLDFELNAPMERGTLHHLIRNLALIDKGRASKMASFEEAHNIGLAILEHIISSADSMILLEVNFGVHEVLQQLHNDSHIITGN
jgi:Broad-minded protein